jgi:hypothetical protein
VLFLQQEASPAPRKLKGIQILLSRELCNSKGIAQNNFG